MQQSAVLSWMALVVLVLGPSQATGNGFLADRPGSLRSKVDGNAFFGDLKHAMGKLLGCGGHVEEQELAAIEKTLLPMWHTLPKNSLGRIERRSLRYIVYRYFIRTSSLMIRGFEPSRPVNSSSWGSADILSQRVPAYVESVLESTHAKEQGFDLHNTVAMVATLQQLVFDSESTLLETVYTSQRKPTKRQLSSPGLEQVLKEYMVRWMMGDARDEGDFRELLLRPFVLQEIIPHWDKVIEFTRGRIRALDYERQRRPQSFKRSETNGISQRYSFDDAHKVVGEITTSFASFWESECAAMKELLVKMDTHGTGRVPLSRFYSSTLDDGEWRFGESESYLRELGALDETSAWRGKQVIIPNYIQASSNCVIAQPHYMVCCATDCESILEELEGGIGEAMADPKDILALVGNLSSHVTIDLDDTPDVKGSLAAQLEAIAAAHGGKVPLHGRLFTQWLHYVFPRDCAFPHKTGSVTTKSPAEYGDHGIASDGDMLAHAISANSSDIPAVMDKEELQWMSQWSEEEELIADYAGHMRAPWEVSGRWMILAGAVLLMASGIAGFAGIGHKAGGGGASELLPLHGKAHFV